MEFISQLKERLGEPLPGIKAQLKMTNTKIGVYEQNKQKYLEASKEAKKACVMILLFQKEEVWHTALMQRPESPYPHSKQISLPGGGLEEQDDTLEAGALRETEEEFGIPAQNIQTLGRLSELYIPVSGYLVHPFVGYLKEAPTYTPDPNEVDEIIEVKVEDLLNPALRKHKDITTSSGHHLRDVLYFDLNDKVVWGATAMMLSEFVTILESLDRHVLS